MEAKQITINDTAEVLYQADATNPMPGVVIGRLTKGEHVLSPTFEVQEGGPLGMEEAGAAVQMHMDTVLARLAGMRDLSAAAEPVAEICRAIYQGAGIAERASLLTPIKALDEDMRAFLRNKGVRLGPILLFCPDLNKPAAVRLRATLYALYHGMELPAPVVPDGMVSQVVEASRDVLKGFYKTISYPVYGPRAIRIDMLDRVVNQVYELADKGQFRAQHQMAEWLGCGIEDLYAVLGALGHSKIEEEVKAASEDAVEAVAPKEGEEKPADVKPELAAFRLKKGTAHSASAPLQRDKGGVQAKPKYKKPVKKKGKPSEPRVMSAEAPKVADEDSPWAALAALKK